MLIFYIKNTDQVSEIGWQKKINKLRFPKKCVWWGGGERCPTTNNASQVSALQQNKMRTEDVNAINHQHAKLTLQFYEKASSFKAFRKWSQMLFGF